MKRVEAVRFHGSETNTASHGIIAFCVKLDLKFSGRTGVIYSNVGGCHRNSSAARLWQRWSTTAILSLSLSREFTLPPSLVRSFSLSLCLSLSLSRPPPPFLFPGFAAGSVAVSTRWRPLFRSRHYTTGHLTTRTVLHQSVISVHRCYFSDKHCLLLLAVLCRSRKDGIAL